MGLVILTHRRIGTGSLTATTLFRQVVASRGWRTRRHQTHVAISVESSVVLSSLGIGTFRSRARVAGAAIRRVLIPTGRIGTRCVHTRSRSLQVETLRRRWTFFHWASVGIHVRAGVICAWERIRAPRGGTTVRRTAVRRVIITSFRTRAR